MKKALLIGINNYRLPGNDLRGCVNDIIAMKSILAGHGYEITTLSDNQATKSAIVSALTTLVQSGASQMVFHYSGHGTQFFDPISNINKDAICPTDAANIDTLITDHQLASILSVIPAGCRLSFIADCCHSGTIDRDFYFSTKSSKSKTMVIPSLARPKSTVISSREIAANGLHILLSGCRDEQTSADACFENIPHGALTYAIMQVVKQNSNQTWRQLHDQIVIWLAKNGFVQVPQLSGPEDVINAPAFV